MVIEHSEDYFRSIALSNEVVLVDTCFFFPRVSSINRRFGYLNGESLPGLFHDRKLSLLKPSIVHACTDNLDFKNSSVSRTPNVVTINDVVNEIGGVAIWLGGRIRELEKMCGFLTDEVKVQLYMEVRDAMRAYMQTLSQTQEMAHEGQRTISVPVFADEFSSLNRAKKHKVDRRLFGVALYYAVKNTRCAILTRDRGYLHLQREAKEKYGKRARFISLPYLNQPVN